MSVFSRRAAVTLAVLVALSVTDRSHLEAIRQAQDRSGISGKLSERSRRWRCEAEQKWGCGLPNGCERQDPRVVWLVLDLGRNTYQRCDQSGCDEYPAKVIERGIFTYIQPTDHPDSFVKVGLGDLFVEVAAQGVSVLNSFGTCKPQR
jgi:hypothetical protein